jgi:hypothetical protein
VWSLLWDIYDSAGDTNDTVSLGFTPMWNVLIGAQKNTPAFTSIFSFITALKAANPASAATIDTLVAAQNITSSTMDIYGSTETHVPTTFATVDTIPLYATATIGGGPVIVQNVSKAGHYNTLGNHSYIKFTVASSRIVTITVATSNPATTADPDFLLFENGVLVTSAEGSTVGSETTSLTLQPATYVIDAYDCANGCSSTEGTPGNYQLTVTIN